MTDDELKERMKLAPNDLKRRIEIARAAHDAAPAKWRQGSRANADYYAGAHTILSEDRLLLECNTNFIPEGRAIAAHIAANDPQAVIELCEALLAAREEIARLHEVFVKIEDRQQGEPYSAHYLVMRVIGTWFGDDDGNPAKP